MKKIVVLMIITLNFMFGDMVEYQSIDECAKPSSYISMSYSVDNNNSIGDNIDIETHLISDINAKIVSLDIKEDKELDIVSVDKIYKELDNRDTYDINITTKSLIDGEFYITLYVKTEYNNNFRYKSFIIPVQIGTPKIEDSKSSSNYIIYRGVESVSRL